MESEVSSRPTRLAYVFYVIRRLSLIAAVVVGAFFAEYLIFRFAVSHYFTETVCPSINAPRFDLRGCNEVPLSMAHTLPFSLFMVTVGATVSLASLVTWVINGDNWADRLIVSSEAFEQEHVKE